MISASDTALSTWIHWSRQDTNPRDQQSDDFTFSIQISMDDNVFVRLFNEYQGVISLDHELAVRVWSFTSPDYDTQQVNQLLISDRMQAGRMIFNWQDTGETSYIILGTADESASLEEARKVAEYYNGLDNNPVSNDTLMYIKNNPDLIPVLTESPSKAVDHYKSGHLAAIKLTTHYDPEIDQMFLVVYLTTKNISLKESLDNLDECCEDWWYNYS